MGGGGHRDRLGDRVDAVGAASGQDRREAPLPHLGPEVPGVEVHVLGVLLPHPARDRLGDDVPGRQLGQLVLPQHEADPVRVHQVRALAPYRLGDQRLLALGARAQEEHGRVELDELQVGDLGPGAQREGHAVAGRDRRVGGGGEDLAHAAGGEDHRGGVDGADAVVLPLVHDVQGHPGRTARRVRQEVQDEGVLDGVHAPVAYRLDQGAGDLGAGRVPARVGDPAAVVAALAGQRDLAPGGRVEVGAGLDQPADRVRPLGDQGPHRALVAQPGTGHEGVVEVLLGGVALAERGGDAALGPAGGAVVEQGLGDDDRTEPGGGAAQGGGQAGDAGADHDHVGVDGPARLGGVQPCSGHLVAPRVGDSGLGGPKRRGMLSMRRVLPTRAATARTASPSWSSATSVKSAGSTRAR